MSLNRGSTVHDKYARGSFILIMNIAAVVVVNIVISLELMYVVFPFLSSLKDIKKLYVFVSIKI